MELQKTNNLDRIANEINLPTEKPSIKIGVFLE